MRRFFKIGEAASLLGVSASTLRRWERKGTLVPAQRSEGRTRYYSQEQIFGGQVAKEDGTVTIGYARVSSHDQKKDLATQAALLSSYCTSMGWQHEIIEDLGSGMNDRKKGLKTLLDRILEGRIRRLVLTHRDRLLRFGAELIFALCEARRVEVVIINQSDELSFEQELVQDVLEIITIFSARLYGSRSKRNQKLVEAAKLLIT